MSLYTDIHLCKLQYQVISPFNTLVCPRTLSYITTVTIIKFHTDDIIYYRVHTQISPDVLASFIYSLFDTIKDYALLSFTVSH